MNDHSIVKSDQEHTECTKCLFDSKKFAISVNSEGVCNYCLQIAELKQVFEPHSQNGFNKLKILIERIKFENKSKKFDCIVGVSGGTDSSYLLMKCVDWGLRPLAVHYDNTFNSAIASQNIYRITKKLNVELETFVIDSKLSERLKKSFLLARVREFDADTDIAYVQVLRTMAAKFKTKYIFEAHSFLEEGLTPAGTNYLDGSYISDIYKKFEGRKLKNFPNMKFITFMKWIIIYRQKFIRPLWYISYNKEVAAQELEHRLGWINYQGHHLENYSSKFAHRVWLPLKFGIDYRILNISAKLREGNISRLEAKQILDSPLPEDSELRNYILDRLEISTELFNYLIAAPSNSFRNFKTYNKLFYRLRFFFLLLAKMNLVPMSFYMKYCRSK